MNLARDISKKLSKICKQSEAVSRDYRLVEGPDGKIRCEELEDGKWRTFSSPSRFTKLKDILQWLNFTDTDHPHEYTFIDKTGKSSTVKV